MSKLVRNVLIGGGVAFAVSALFGFLEGLTHAQVGGLGQMIGAVLGVSIFFILHMRSGNRRVESADAASRARALTFTARPDRALVYFVRTGFAGSAVGVDIEIDGATLAQVKSPRFTCAELSPGAHTLRASVPGQSSLTPQPVQMATTLQGGSVTVLHVGIERGLVRSTLKFEPWTLDDARTALGKMEMVAAQALPA